MCSAVPGSILKLTKRKSCSYVMVNNLCRTIIIFKLDPPQQLTTDNSPTCRSPLNKSKYSLKKNKTKQQQQRRRLTTVGRTLYCYKTSNLPHQTLFDQYTPELFKTLPKGRASDESIIFWSRIFRLQCCSGSYFEKDRLSAVSLRGRRSKGKG